MIDLNSPWRKGRPKWGPAQLTKNILSQDRHSLGKPQNRQRGEMGKTALSCCSLLIRLQKPSKNSPCMYLPQFTRCKTVRHNRISFIFLFIHWSSLNAILKSIENVTFVNHYPVHSYGKLVKYFYFIFFFWPQHVGFSFPTQVSNPWSLQWKHRVSTAGPPGKSLSGEYLRKHLRFTNMITRDQIANIHWIIKRARGFQKSIYFCFIDYAKAFDCVDHNKLWKILRDENTRLPDLPLEKSICRSGSNS